MPESQMPSTVMFQVFSQSYNDQSEVREAWMRFAHDPYEVSLSGLVASLGLRLCNQ